MKNLKIIINITIYLTGLSFCLFAQSKHPYHGGWSTPAVQAQNVTQYSFQSRYARDMVNYHVFMPTQLKTYTGPVPTLIWLHGSFSSLKGIKPFAGYIQKAIDNRQIQPMAVVFPHGMNQSLWVDSKDGSVPMEQVLIKELIPDLKNHFNFRPDRVKPIISGFSMGGYGSARLYFKYPELFSAGIALAAGPLNENFETTSGNRGQREVLLEEIFGGSMDYYRRVNPRGEALKFSKRQAKPYTKFAIICGDRDKTYKENERFHEYLNELKIRHRYIVAPGVDHNMQQVLNSVGDQFLKLLKGVVSSSLSKYKKNRKKPRGRKNTRRAQRR